jgi:hypothetical protein
MSALATSSCSQRLTSHRHHLTSEKKREMFESARWERRSLAPPQPSSLVETYVVATTFSPTRIFNRPTVINGRNARPRLRSTAECRRDDWVVGGVHWTWRGGRPVGWEGARAGLAATRRLRAAGFRTVPTLPRSLSLVFLTELPSLLLNLITDRTVSIA